MVMLGDGSTQNMSNALKNNAHLKGKRKTFFDKFSKYNSKKSLAHLKDKKFDQQQLFTFREDVERQKRRDRLTAAILIVLGLSVLFIMVYFISRS